MRTIPPDVLLSIWPCGNDEECAFAGARTSVDALRRTSTERRREAQSDSANVGDTAGVAKWESMAKALWASLIPAELQARVIHDSCKAERNVRQ